jgi:hypothetical protein
MLIFAMIATSKNSFSDHQFRTTGKVFKLRNQRQLNCHDTTNEVCIYVLYRTIGWSWL